MPSIQLKVQDFRGKGEKNYETDKINKESMNEFRNLIADQNPKNTKHGKQNTKSKPGTTFVVGKTS